MVAMLNKTCQMFGQNEPIEDCDRRSENDVVDHQSFQTLTGKAVIVPKRAEWAANYSVLKVRRRFEPRNSYTHIPPKPEMPASPFHFLAIPKQSGWRFANDLLARCSGRMHMKIDTACEIETSLPWGVDSSLQNDFRYRTLCLHSYADLRANSDLPLFPQSASSHAPRTALPARCLPVAAAREHAR
jgi:hypothetical protein